MAREIKFRGMDISGNWYEGNLAVIPKKIRNTVDAGSYISNAGGMPFAYQVRPETVGESTGLKDKHGVEVFEGDIFRAEDSDGDGQMHTYQMVFIDAAFVGKSLDGGMDTIWAAFWHPGEQMKVIGNIHENPDLLEVKDA